MAKVDPPHEGKGTRSELLSILKRADGREVSQLAKELDISGVAVRRHLSVLDRDGHVCYRTAKRGRGRPVRIYQLTETAETFFPNRSGGVAQELLQRVQDTAGAKAVNSAMQSRMDDLQKRYEVQLRGARSLKKRMEKLAEVRDAEGNYCSLKPAPADRVKGGVRLVLCH